MRKAEHSQNCTEPQHLFQFGVFPNFYCHSQGQYLAFPGCKVALECEKKSGRYSSCPWNFYIPGDSSEKGE